MNPIMASSTQRHYIQSMTFIIAIMVMIFDCLIIAAGRITNQLRWVTQLTRFDGLINYCSGLMLIIVFWILQILSKVFSPGLFNFGILEIFFCVLDTLLLKVWILLVMTSGEISIMFLYLWLLTVLSGVLIVSSSSLWVTTAFLGYLISANFTVSIVTIFSIFGLVKFIKGLELLTTWAKFHFTYQKIKPLAGLAALLSRQQTNKPLRGRLMITDMRLNKKCADWFITA